MFFEQIDRMIGRDADLILTIRKTDDGTLTVAAHTRMNGVEDEARHYIAPFTASGTPQELDTGFIPALAEPAVKTQGLLTNLKQYEKQLETARANSKAEKERKDKEAKEAKERKEKCDKYRKKADEQTAAGKYADALTNLRQARLHATGKRRKRSTRRFAPYRPKRVREPCSERRCSGRHNLLYNPARSLSLPSVRQPPLPLTWRRTPAIPTASSSISRKNAGRKTLVRIWTGTHYSKPKPFIKDIDYGTCC
ncbi:MAG: PRTRC system protein E [Alistipes ihumii]